MVDVFKALGDENRLRIINLLIKGELCVCEIETILDMSQSNVSRHLTKLKNARLINSFKKQQWVFYQLSDEFRNSATLLSYIEANLDSNKIYKADNNIYKKYKKNNLDCNSISHNKTVVINLIYQEGNNE